MDVICTTRWTTEENNEKAASPLSLRLCLVERESAIQCNTLALPNDNKREECGTVAVARGSLAGGGREDEGGRTMGLGGMGARRWTT